MSGKSELRIFDGQLPQVVVDNANFVDINPSTSLSESGSTIEFVINASESEYLDLNDSLLYLLLKVTTADGKALADNALPTPTNYFMNALFSDVTLSFNNQVIEGGNHLYSYKSTIESIFCFSKESKRIQLAPMGYHETEGERKKWLAGSRPLELSGALRLDFLNQPKYLIPGVGVNIKLTRSENKFPLIHGAGDPQIKIMQAKLYVRRVKVNPSVALAHVTGLQTRNALYPYNRGQVISYSVPAGAMSHFKDHLFSTSLLPKFVVVGMVSSSAFNGSELEANPFFFEHFGVNSVGLFRDGQSIPYRELYQPNFEKNLYTCDYVKSIIQCPQHLNTNLSNGITMKAFADAGYTFFTFNLTPDFDYTQCQMPKDGNLRLELKFSKALAKAINVIVYATFDHELQITKDREIVQPNAH